MRKSKFRISYYILILMILFFAIVPVLTDFTLRNDEGFTMSLIRHSFSKVIYLDSLDVHPPLYYLLLKLFITCTTFYTNSIIIKIVSARLFSLLAISMSIYVLRKLFKILNIKNIGIIMIGLILISPSILFFSTSIRMYALATLFLVLVLFNTVQFLRFGYTRYFVMSLAYGLCDVYTDYFAAVQSAVVIIAIIILELYKRNIKNVILFIVEDFIFVTSCLPWIIYSSYKQTSSKITFTIHDLFKICKYSLKNILNVSTGIQDSSINSFIWRRIIELLLFLLILYITYWSYKHMSQKFNIVFTISIATLIMSSCVGAVSFVILNKFSARVLFPSFFINISFIIIILLNMYEFKSFKLIKIIKYMFIIILMLSGLFTCYYDGLNILQSNNLITILRECKYRKSVFIHNNNLSTGNTYEQPLLTHNKYQFQIINKDVYLYYMGKDLITDRHTSAKNSPVAPMGDKLEEKLLPNIYVKHYYK